MKFVVKVNDRRLLLTAQQVEAMVELLVGCEYYDEKYVGKDNGSLGSNNAYIPEVKPCNIDEWFDAKVMRDDYVETVKLAMKLEKDT